jgi:hypothetical protein
MFGGVLIMWAPKSSSLTVLLRTCTAMQIEADVIAGSTLEAFRRLLLLALLQDDKVLQGGPLQASMLLSTEEMLLSHPPADQRDMLLTTVVNLTRMINSGAAEIQGRCIVASWLGVVWGWRLRPGCLTLCGGAPTCASSLIFLY